MMAYVWKWSVRLLGAVLALLLLFLLYGGYAYRDHALRETEFTRGVSYLDVGPAEIAYRVEGLDHKGETPVILLHAMFFHMGMWDDWAAELALSRPVYRFDVPGHGLSSLSEDGDYSLQGTMNALQALMDHHEIDRAILVGASMGGATLFNFTAANPERVEKLVLVNSGGLEGHDQADSGGLPDGAYWVLRYMPDWSLDQFVDWLTADNHASEAFKSDFIRGFRNLDIRRGIIGRMQDFKSPDTVAVLPQIQVPTLVMWGEKNPQLPVAQAGRFKELIERSGNPVTLRIYEGAGHLLPVEGESAAIRDLVAFLDREDEQ
ncbi:Carboxylesterase YbfK [Microbulbifer aggregans]|uniref:Carboxylesterase YbfK n=1 Tax=Microbulbifer aggregans TaxID=1769779 RepID=A0A1C9W3T9_9GAMM|nr:alpha/beta hydrolase [Microbulbifer aggregans]AOS95818.1 Carboxylesterase YbfK [Microbulbifer aggregans]